ncbi:hypothetical protein J7E85_03610 [Paenibacillus sp. ISL-20]|nr:hypothetical protein [Paenibacillus sp. ISL-20]
MAKAISRHRPGKRWKILIACWRDLKSRDRTRLCGDLFDKRSRTFRAGHPADQGIRWTTPAGSLIGVTYLAFPEQLIEISAVAHAD